MTDKSRSVTIGSYPGTGVRHRLLFGLLQSNQWYGVFDFTTLNGSFGTMVQSVSENGDGLQDCHDRHARQGGQRRPRRLPVS